MATRIWLLRLLELLLVLVHAAAGAACCSMISLFIVVTVWVICRRLWQSPLLLLLRHMLQEQDASWRLVENSPSVAANAFVKEVYGVEANTCPYTRIDMNELSLGSAAADDQRQ